MVFLKGLGDVAVYFIKADVPNIHIASLNATSNPGHIIQSR